MKRYHEEKHIIENRVQLYKQLGGYLGPQHEHYVPTAGKFRKTLRCAGCGKARCTICHSEKFPKRIPTRKEVQARYDDRRGNGE
jgi:hypothetical protein